MLPFSFDRCELCQRRHLILWLKFSLRVSESTQELSGTESDCVIRKKIATYRQFNHHGSNLIRRIFKTNGSYLDFKKILRKCRLSQRRTCVNEVLVKRIVAEDIAESIFPEVASGSYSAYGIVLFHPSLGAGSPCKNCCKYSFFRIDGAKYAPTNGQTYRAYFERDSFKKSRRLGKFESLVSPAHLIHSEPLHERGSCGGRERHYREHVFFFNVTSTRRGRIFNAEQRIKLLRQYNSDPYPDLQKRRELADEMKTTARSIQIWFQNRRQRDELNRAMK
ncbi:hypothetical protein PROFUN_07367 [Planoprotostelium fungivorum]|uniref:Homeobox domain-containing protein n=1 Tax=Planoprotostelium fungivorum TaxID=1890364 RepID=A0A2P6NM47_9EUKA|nr:hypothetical protein PROFUN_07367 [Planoprotostelium fungivorum]